MRRLFSLVVAVPLVGCKPELPPLDYHGERVRVGSDKVDQVCGGTLARLDREVEQIEARLDLPIQVSPIDVYIMDHEAVDAYCSGGASCTVFPSKGASFVVMDQRNFEWSIAHELVHARLAAITSAPLFDEGIAEAVSPPSCPRPTPDIELSQVLSATESDDWDDVRGTYYVGGELVAWLLEAFGPLPVLEFMRFVHEGASPSVIEGEYLERFDRELDVDFLAHLRTQADLDALAPEHFGCLGPAIDSSKGPARLVADLDCDSDRVHNTFGVDASGYVEWTLHVDHEQTLALVGAVPFGTSLTIEACGCIPNKGEDKTEYLLARRFGPYETLQPGSYRLRWVGALDEGLALDVQLVQLVHFEG